MKNNKGDELGSEGENGWWRRTGRDGDEHGRLWIRVLKLGLENKTNEYRVIKFFVFN